MPDESSRSAPSQGPQRRDGAPEWWSELERADLPEDRVTTAVQSAWFTEAEPTSVRHVAGMQGIPTRRRAWLINAVAVVVALAVIMLALGVDSPRSVLIVGLLFGVPIVLVAITATVAARRAR
jgi:hypothetical protein